MMGQIKGLVKTGMREGLSAAGGMAGSYMGNAKLGRKVGKTLAAKLSKLVGTGDYASNTTDLAVNSLIKPGTTQYATFGDNTSCVRIQHREYIRDVYAGSPGSFSSTSVQVNPGLSSSFPYLSGIAGNFEEYRVNGMVFEVVSTTSPYNSVSAMGSIIVAMQYNAANSPFTSKAQMENSDFAISARIDKSIMYGVECKDLATNNLYIREQDISNEVPLTSTDVGLLQVALQTGTGVPANSVIGELWVSYDVDLMRPHITTRSVGGTYASQLTFPTGVDSAVYATVNAGYERRAGRSGIFSSDTLTSYPQYTDTYLPTSVMDLSTVAGAVYRLDIESYGVGGQAYPTVTVPGAVKVGSFPTTYTSAQAYNTVTEWWRVDSLPNGKTSPQIRCYGFAAGSKLSFAWTYVAPATEFIMLNPVAGFP